MDLAEGLRITRGALADIAHSDDMTLETARRKAARIYAETAASDTDPIPAFASGLKAHLRKEWYEFVDIDPVDEHPVILWPALDAAIDAFAAECQRGGNA